MAAIKDGGSAFPRMEVSEEWSEDKGMYVKVRYLSDGMSLRDYFAAHAPDSEYQNFCNPNEIGVQWRWRYANAMLREREQS